MMVGQTAGWSTMWDGVVFGTFNHEGGPRGGTQFRSQNWLMLMAHRKLGSGTLSLNGMFSVEPATVGAAGYLELFQHGEAYKGLPVVDAQHPHDAFMQLDASFAQPIGQTTIILSGGPSSSPALGPTPFMHRLSASENPTAALTHHTFDSTHVTFGVVTLGVRRGWFTLEASAFKGREPDWKRWDLNLGKFDSGSGRLTIRPHREWEFQVSRGRLIQPEELEPGNQNRTNGSLSWTRLHADGGFTAVTIMSGRVSRTYSWTGAFVAEGTHWMGKTAVFGRYEGTGVETEHLLFPQSVHRPHPGELVDPLHAVTAGATRRLFRGAGIDVALGGDLTFYRVPPRLREPYGPRPLAAHVQFRVRPLKAAPMSMDMSMPADHQH
ncbi:MAG TPA: hypothetical protein VM032_11275 [Vicinamibacterales bacterium]|nr:hypothetical protein [Vicinamibacterales bacterium]